MKTYIIGHQKPDTDAAVSALALKHLFDQNKCWGHPDSTACITHPLNPETKFVFNKFNQAAPKLITSKNIKSKDKIVLVDHNEKPQRLTGLNPNQITDIFDHHKLNINLNHPIFVTTKPWGSTCTIAWFLMDLHHYKIPTVLASLMLAAILSDTVAFKSSTTTDMDKKAAKNLAKITKLDIDKFGLKILQAKSDISGLTIKEIVVKDYKVYDFKDSKVFINQLETVEPQKILNEKKSEMLKALAKLKQKENYDYAFIAITDILKLNTRLLFPSNDELKITKTAFKLNPQNNLLDIGPRLSRKKDIAPAIEKALL